MFFKIGVLKNFPNHTGKTPALKSPFKKTTRSQARRLIKTRLQHKSPPAKLFETPNNTFDGSFWRKAKYDLSLKVRGQLPYGMTKREGITLHKQITKPYLVEIIKTFRAEKVKSTVIHNTWHNVVSYN